MKNLYKKYFENLTLKEYQTTDALHLLTDEERLALAENQKNALLVSALLGALGVVLYFLPIHLFPKLFLTINLNRWFAVDFELGYVEIIYGVVLMILELHFLVLVNLKAVHKMGEITGFYNTSTLDNNVDFLYKLGMDSKELGLDRYGIDPYQDVNKKLLFLFNLLLILKGFLANKLLQYAVKRLLGRYAIRYVVDYIGVPIYMIINAYATYMVLKKAKVCIMGSNLIGDFMKNINFKNINDSEKELIYDTLQLIAMSKRDYHQNHFLLTEAIFKHFDITPKAQHIFQPIYYQNLLKSSENIQKLCNDILFFGFVLDGRISSLEIKKIKILNELGLLKFTPNEFKQMCNNFLNGIPMGY